MVDRDNVGVITHMYFGTSSTISSAVAPAISLGFSMAQFPAAIAGTSGLKRVMMGKFQVPMIKQLAQHISIRIFRIASP
jgi:hypothetical protein